MKGGRDERGNGGKDVSMTHRKGGKDESMIGGNDETRKGGNEERLGGLVA